MSIGVKQVETKIYQLYKLLRDSADGVTPAEVSQALGWKMNSVTVYLWWLKSPKHYNIPLTVTRIGNERRYRAPAVDFEDKFRFNQNYYKKPNPAKEWVVGDKNVTRQPGASS